MNEERTHKRESIAFPSRFTAQLETILNNV